MIRSRSGPWSENGQISIVILHLWRIFSTENVSPLYLLNVHCKLKESKVTFFFWDVLLGGRRTTLTKFFQ